MLAAAAFPAATARMTVAGPETASPPANTLSTPGTELVWSAWMAPRTVATPTFSKARDSMAWPMATIT